jgi:hypothetical protein
VLVLGRHLLLDLGLEAPQQEGPQHAVQPLDQPLRSDGSRGRARRSTTLDQARERVGEPVLELRVARKHLRHQEVHQRPQLHQVVLQGSARDQQAALGREPQQRLPPLRLPVLDHVRLVQDQVPPFLAPKHLGVLKSEGVRGDAHVKAARARPPFALELALLGGAVIGEQLERRAPLLELHLPVEHDAIVVVLLWWWGVGVVGVGVV